MPKVTKESKVFTVRYKKRFGILFIFYLIFTSIPDLDSDSTAPPMLFLPLYISPQFSDVNTAEMVKSRRLHLYVMQSMVNSK